MPVKKTLPSPANKAEREADNLYAELHTKKTSDPQKLLITLITTYTITEVIFC